MKGLTLIEIIIVIAAIVVLVGLSFGFYGYFQPDRNLDLQQETLIRTLRVAQTKAQTGLNNSAFGLYFEENQYTSFQGSSYEEDRDPDYDLVYRLPNGITMAGLTEIVFAKITGQPSLGGSLTLTDSNTGSFRVVSVNLEGLIQ